MMVVARPHSVQTVLNQGARFTTHSTFDVRCWVFIFPAYAGPQLLSLTT